MAWWRMTLNRFQYAKANDCESPERALGRRIVCDAVRLLYFGRFDLTDVWLLCCCKPWS